MLSFTARIGLELGADIIKMKYPVDLEGFKWVVKCAGRAKVIAAGMSKTSEEDLIHRAHNILQTGASGMAIGRNIWQHEKPYSLSKALRAVIFNKKTPEEATEFLKC